MKVNSAISLTRWLVDSGCSCVKVAVYDCANYPYAIEIEVNFEFDGGAISSSKLYTHDEIESSQFDIERHIFALTKDKIEREVFR